MRLLSAGLLAAGLMLTASHAEAAAVVPGVFNANTLPSNDDGSTGLVNIGFNVNFFGTTYSQLYVNNNGNVTFDSPLSTFTPFGLTTNPFPIIAPFFADVDTRDIGGVTPDTTYGTGTYNGHAAFGVNWLNVDYFVADATNHQNHNTFQLIMVDRSDISSGDFDFIFNYDQIQWETGQASGSDPSGCGGTSAHVGWTNGDAADFELAGSGVNGAFVDSGPCHAGPGANALIQHSLNSDILGQYVFNVRNGIVEPPPSAPEPASILLIGTGLIGIGRRYINRKRTNA
jgi:hypothetical protein